LFDNTKNIDNKNIENTKNITRKTKSLNVNIVLRTSKRKKVMKLSKK
jgi:hypothetical protein